ncbi:MAG: DNA topoisomerase 4 subunit A [Eubacteriales bacterium]|nr:DNA topoisomerase 4 subunit A [Eubacteriales bacterium]
MAKQPPVNPITPDIIQMPLEDVMHMSMMPYAEHVILERALPRVEDGLKPVQRRILYTMMELGNTPDKPHRKCARIVDDCLGKYHPHGDSSVYDALVRMAQGFSLRATLVDGHGNFGSIDGDSAAAMRYTEARMAPLALQMLRDLDKDTVPFHLNFDDTLKEPEILPARFPNLLVNGASGIAVGLATNIPPHNLSEVIRAVDLRIDKPKATLDDFMQVLPAPDFPTGGVLLDTPEIRAAYQTGRGKLTLRARVHIEKGPLGRSLICITEVPYGVNKADMLSKILKLSDEKKAIFGCIHDIRDESDRTGLRAVVEIKKDYDPNKVLQKLYKYSDLQVTYGVNMVAIYQGKPVQMGLIAMLDAFIEHQKNVITRRSQYDLDQAKARDHIVEGLIHAVDVLDEVIKTIRASKNGKEARERLCAQFGLTEVQAQAILDLRLQRLTGLEILALREEAEQLHKRIAELEAILGSERKLLGVIKKELGEIGEQYGDERRTTILREEEIPPVEEDDLETPVPEDAVVLYTRGGQLRRMAPRIFDKLDLTTQESDMPLYLLRTQTDHTLLFFTDRGQCYPLAVSAINESLRPKERGVALTGILQGIEADEKCVRILDIAPKAFESTPDLLFFTQNGLVKRSAATEYAVRRQRFAALALKDGDRVVDVALAQPHADVAIIARSGMSIRFTLDTVPAQGRASGGVKGIALAIGDQVIRGCTLQNSEQMLVFSESGYAKRIPGAMLDPQGRGGKGVKCFGFNKNGSNGSYIAACVKLSGVRDFTVLQAGGMLSPMNSESIACQSLADKGKTAVIALMDDVVTDIILW